MKCFDEIGSHAACIKLSFSTKKRKENRRFKNRIVPTQWSSIFFSYLWLRLNCCLLNLLSFLPLLAFYILKKSNILKNPSLPIFIHQKQSLFLCSALQIQVPSRFPYNNIFRVNKELREFKQAPEKNQAKPSPSVQSLILYLTLKDFWFF